MTSIAELERRIRTLESATAGINRVGRVTALVPEKGAVRVEFGDRSNLVSFELPVMVKQTLKNKDSYMPDVGEHVVCSFLGNGLEQGFVLGAIYSNADTAVNSDPNKRGVTFEDGTEVYYDRIANKLQITVAGNGLVEVICKEASVNAEISATVTTETATVEASASVTLDTPTTSCTGNLVVDGSISYGQGMNGTGGANVNGGIIVSGGSVTHNGKNIGSTHTHTGVQTGGGTTGAPT